MNAMTRAVYAKDPAGKGVPMIFTKAELDEVVEAAVADALREERWSWDNYCANCDE